MEPEKELWIAVLHQAVNDTERLLEKVRKKPALWNNHLFRSEVRHLKTYFRTQSMEPGGFGFICSLMAIDPASAFRQIEEKYLRHLMPVEERPKQTVDLQMV
ncbi:MAG: hypothetical protein HQM06_17855 [Magnetococcales bacterium]|nr:hypothetical protein [Magnetococcales bacterium]